MPYRLWREWEEYEKIEPFGEKRADLRMGFAMAQLAAALGSKPKGQKGWRPKDFMPNFTRAKAKSKTPRQIYDHMIAVTRLMGGKIIDKRNNG